MEYEIDTLSSEPFHKKKLEHQLALIQEASEKAEEAMKYDAAHNKEIIKAIEIVEDFLRETHRICYGGQAINAHLPTKYKFYDPEYSIPDYDFFSPTQDADVKTMVQYLKTAGFKEISAREGMHDGTIKLYVNFIAVADITQLDPTLYGVLSAREYRIDGISYLDANALRMLMYLELSRPRGEVSRWKKVYERLALFNEFVSGKLCHVFDKRRGAFKNTLTKKQSQYILRFVIEHRRIFAGGDLLGFYEDVLRKKKQHPHWILASTKPIVFLSSSPEEDAASIIGELHLLSSYPKKKEYAVKSFATNAGVDIIPSITMIVQGTRPIVIIVHHDACSAYHTIPLYEHRHMRIASMDTMITLYFGLGLMDMPYFDMNTMECLAHEMVQLSIKAREKPNSFIFPFISTTCVGYQKSMPSLIRSKIRRITEKRKKLKILLNPEKKRKTMKLTRNT
jgi:hypothetical protein